MSQPQSSEWANYIIASDFHSQFVDEQAFRILLNVLSDDPPDCLIINGDLLDFTSISDHAKKIQVLQPTILAGYRFEDEIEFTRKKILMPLREAMGSKPKMAIRLGNHDLRALRPSKSNSDAMAEIMATCARRNVAFGVDMLDKLLELKNSKIDATLSKNGKDILFKTFTVVHGANTSKAAPKRNLEVYGSGTSGHTHRVNCHTQLLHGKIQGWWESGCMRRMKDVEYVEHGVDVDWCHAFLRLRINKNTGLFFCTPHIILDGKCDYNGRLYKV